MRPVLSAPRQGTPATQFSSENNERTRRISTIRLGVLTQCRNVTDGQADGHQFNSRVRAMHRNAQ